MTTRADRRTHHPDDALTVRKRAAFAAWHSIDSGAFLFRQINRLTVRMTYLLATLMLCIVSAADFFTGIELMMSPMYAFPCLLMDWRIGRLQAVLYAAGATYVQWLVGTFGGRTYSHASYIYWDILLNIIFYGALIWVVAKLRLALEMERVLSRVDFLTRLANRESLYEVLNLEVQRSRRYGRSLTIISVDCENFKRFNAKRGHTTGDLLLQAIADVLTRKFRNTDIVTRSGDDEFMVVLPETGAQHMEAVLDGLRTQLDNLMLMRGWNLKFSCACSVFVCPPEDLNKVLHLHAKVMASAKANTPDKTAQKVWESQEPPFKSSEFENTAGLPTCLEPPSSF